MLLCLQGLGTSSHYVHYHHGLYTKCWDPNHTIALTCTRTVIQPTITETVPVTNFATVTNTANTYTFVTPSPVQVTEMSTSTLTATVATVTPSTTVSSTTTNTVTSTPPLASTTISTTSTIVVSTTVVVRTTITTTSTKLGSVVKRSTTRNNLQTAHMSAWLAFGASHASNAFIRIYRSACTLLHVLQDHQVRSSIPP
uniref:Uncharacterized protein n=1 Tax=Anopheles culicifacies TaxID=139723 RepID=A0A182MPP0_9DIPT